MLRQRDVKSSSPLAIMDSLLIVLRSQLTVSLSVGSHLIGIDAVVDIDVHGVDTAVREGHVERARMV